MKISDSVIVITGGAKGLGKAMASIFVKKGAQVMISGRDEVGLKQTAEELSVTSFPADVTNESEVINLAKETIAKFGRIDIWINNAGVWIAPTQLTDLDMSKVQNLFQTNLIGTIHGMRAAINHMSTNKKGTIVNIISTTAFDGMNGSSGSIYVASKYALRGLTNAVRKEMKDSPIKILAVYPGGIKTDLFNEAKPKNINEFMSAEEVAQKIVDNIEKEEPKEQLILLRPGQTLPHELI